MLKRYMIIMAVLAGAGVILLTQFEVRPRLQSIIDQRNQFARERDAEKGEKLKAQQTVKERDTVLAAAAKSLEAAQTDQATLKTSLDREQVLTANLRKDLDKANTDKLAAAQEAARLAGFPAQVAKLETANAGLADKNAVLEKQIDELKNPPEFPPADLRAKVIEVDPKWGFVVLDIGQTKRVQPKWNLIVSRGGKLVGKVQIVTVLPNRSIANIVPGWKLDEPLEGDVVLPEIRVSDSTRQGRF